MRFVNFKENGVARLGVRNGDRVVDLAIAAPDLPRDLGTLFEQGEAGLAAVNKALETAPSGSIKSFQALDLLPVVDKPSKIICLGTNYLAHIQESTELTGNSTAPAFPPLFLRGPSSLLAHGKAMIRPNVSNDLDYECELAVVIGKKAHRVKKADALKYVGGYACFNDGSVRDFQLKTSQWTWGKNFDNTGAFGPDLVTPDELPPGARGLRIQTRLNGVILQDSNTDKMIFDVADAIEILSENITLLPGDVIVMGTCEGVGLVRKPPLFMKPGDVCEVEIEGINILVNPIEQEVV